MANMKFTAGTILVSSLILCTLAAIQSPPRISKQPPTTEQLFQVAQSGGNANDKPFLIECEAEGEPAPRYRWIKNGKPFEWAAYDDRISQQPGRGTLVISKPRDEDLGQYQCFAENEWGTATSNSVFVRKAELNSFKDENPISENAVEGQPFQLRCQPPDGWPKPNVHWLLQDPRGSIKSINNSRMTVDPEGNLWFSNVSRNDATEDFRYVCSAASAFRNEYKVGNKVMLQVTSMGISINQNKVAPVLQYVTRKREVAYRGKKVELFCIYGGTPLPQTIWSKDGRVLRINEQIMQGNYGKSLLIKSVTSEDAGSYTCEVSNGVGNAQSYTIHLEVLAAPYFTVEPDIANSAEGESVVFKCEADGVPKPEIKWIHNGKPISEASLNSRRKVMPNSLIIENLTKKDTGNYGCNATNSLGYVYKDVYVNVLALPAEIVQPPFDKATVNGKVVRMTCKVFGVPKPSVKWIRNGQELTGGRYKTMDSGDLEIQNVIFSDAGSYMCFASNPLGQAEASANLVVRDRTRITDEPEDYEIRAGSTATFRCNAIADSSLTLTIDWLSKGEPIDLELEPRFVKSSDNSLIITKTTELDSGVYTCIARTELDETKSQASLIVQDIPNSPHLTGIRCMSDQALVNWSPMGDNRAPIIEYTVQYNTSFTPDTWISAGDKISATMQSYHIPMSPWANYTFRVLAWNSIGPSLPSKHSEVCTTSPDVPHKNPDNVIGRGTTPQNLVVTWTVMPQIEHNAPKFMYRVFYKRDLPGAQWNIEDIHEWQRNSIQVEDQPTYQKYLIKVVAINERGESRVSPREVVGYSGEDVPLQAPGNFSVNKVKSSTSASISWTPVPEESVRGQLLGYKVYTWTDKTGEKGIRETDVEGGNRTNAIIENLTPYSKNYIRIAAYNGRYAGPPSETLNFETPEGVPGTIMDLEAFPLGSTVIFLVWTRPAQQNGILTGYRIYYRVVNGTRLDPLMERKPAVLDSGAISAKLAGLMPDTKYRIHVRATTKMGEGDDYFVEQKTRASQKPDAPDFIWESIPKENGYSNVKVTWQPNLNGRPGNHFFVKYKLRGETVFSETFEEFLSNSIEIRGLLSGEVYIMSVVAVDGDYMTESATQEVETSSEGPIVQPKENVTTAGWFIGMLLAIAFLLLVLILVCVVKRNRGGKYAVHERELAAGRGDYPEEGGFHEYSQPLDTKSGGGGRASLASSSHQDGKHPESDTDSMAEYGEGDTEGMNEDGSFIGQYGRHRKQETNSQAFATLV